jgi:hypothetical protein
MSEAMSSRTPEHYAFFSDKEIYETLCLVHPELEQVFTMQRNMLLSGWSEERIISVLQEGCDAEFIEQVNGTPGHLMKRALHHMATVLDEQRQAQQPKADFN